MAMFSKSELQRSSQPYDKIVSNFNNVQTKINTDHETFLTNGYSGENTFLENAYLTKLVDEAELDQYLPAKGTTISPKKAEKIASGKPQPKPAAPKAKIFGIFPNLFSAIASLLLVAGGIIAIIIWSSSDKKSDNLINTPVSKPDSVTVRDSIKKDTPVKTEKDSVPEEPKELQVINFIEKEIEKFDYSKTGDSLKIMLISPESKNLLIKDPFNFSITANNESIDPFTPINDKVKIQWFSSEVSLKNPILTFEAEIKEGKFEKKLPLLTKKRGNYYCRILLQKKLIYVDKFTVERSLE